VPTDFEPTRQIVIPPGMSGFPDFAALFLLSFADASL